MFAAVAVLAPSLAFADCPASCQPLDLAPHRKAPPAASAQHNVKPRPPAIRRARPAPAVAWSVSPGEDLQNVLSRWANASGWTLVWSTEYSWQIGGRANFEGDLVSAVGGLMTGMQEARPAPLADVYRANRVLVVKDGLSVVR